MRRNAGEVADGIELVERAGSDERVGDGGPVSAAVFTGAEDGGGDWSAIAYSVIGSCQLNGLDPYRYLLDIAPLLTARAFADHAAITPRAWARRGATKAA